MTTVTDAELEALLAGDEPQAAHGACIVCYPIGLPLPAEVVAICGERFDGGGHQWAADIGAGRHKCSKCLAVMDGGNWPCGHA